VINTNGGLSIICVIVCLFDSDLPFFDSVLKFGEGPQSADYEVSIRLTRQSEVGRLSTNDQRSAMEN
jgi:hypothetical protein